MPLCNMLCSTINRSLSVFRVPYENVHPCDRLHNTKKKLHVWRMRDRTCAVNKIYIYIARTVKSGKSSAFSHALCNRRGLSFFFFIIIIICIGHIYACRWDSLHWAELRLTHSKRMHLRLLAYILSFDRW